MRGLDVFGGGEAGGVRRKRMIGWVAPRGAWLCWYMADSLRDVALIRPGLRPAHLPPRGRLCQGGTTKKAFPWGEGGCEADG